MMEHGPKTLTTARPAYTATAASGVDDPTRSRVPLIRWTHGLINRGVMLADAATLLLGAAVIWRDPFPLGSGSNAMFSQGQALVIGLLAGFSFLATLRRIGAYRVERYRRLGPVALDIVAGSFCASLLCGTVIAAFAEHPPELVWLGSRALTLVGLLIAERVVSAILVGTVQRQGLLRVKVAVIGANSQGAMMFQHLARPEAGPHYDMVGLFRDEDDTGLCEAGAITGEVGDLGLYAQSHPVDLIVVCLPWQSAERRSRIIDQVQWIAADVVIPIALDPDHHDESAIPRAQVTIIAGLQTLQIMHRPFKGSQGLLKIAEDYAIGSAALLFFAPLMLLIAIAVRLDSPGPVLFRQARTGFNNKPFMICKFRTMTVDPTDDGSIGTLDRRDPRITRVGAVLRQLSLDELPQLLNVMRGEMSVVGPRPYVPNMLVGQTRFTDSVRQYAARHRIKPGITGWAQANGLRGHALRSLEGARRSVELDIFYITHWSLWFDLRIMARTLMVLAGRNVF